MSCSCDYDAPSFYSRALHQARKQHKCYECRGLIVPGESYEYVSGLWDGWFSSFHTCSRCLEMRIWLKNNLPCFCFAFGTLYEDAAEAIDEAHWRAGDEVKGLRFAFARRVVLLKRLNTKIRQSEEA